MTFSSLVLQPTKKLQPSAIFSVCLYESHAAAHIISIFQDKYFLFGRFFSEPLQKIMTMTFSSVIKMRPCLKLTS